MTLIEGYPIQGHLLIAATKNQTIKAIIEQDYSFI